MNWKDGQKHDVFSVMFSYIALEDYWINFNTNFAIKISNTDLIFAVSQHSANISHNECSRARVLLEQIVLYQVPRSTLKQGSSAGRNSGREQQGCAWPSTGLPNPRVSRNCHTIYRSAAELLRFRDANIKGQQKPIPLQTSWMMIFRWSGKYTWNGAMTRVQAQPLQPLAPTSRALSES